MSRLLAEKDEASPLGDPVWDVDQVLIAQLKEQYKRERKGKKGVKSKFWFCSDLLLSPSSDSLLLFLLQDRTGPNCRTC